jgi:VWFA-related protein
MQATSFGPTLILSAAALLAACGAHSQAPLTTPQPPAAAVNPAPVKRSSTEPPTVQPSAAPPSSQAPSEQPASAKPVSGQPPTSAGQVIRRTFDIIATDVIARDTRGQFIANLKKDDFEVYEDGVRQEIVSFVLTHGGRVYNETPPARPAMEGILLPASRPTNDAAGRIFMIFVDDLHLNFRDTARIKVLFKQIAKELIHEGDMFGIVSTGPSSLAINLTYDRKRLDEAIDKISGAGLKPSDILTTQVGADGPPEVRYRAHVAFDTAYEIMKKLEDVHDRRKAFIYVSNGYDFDPFSATRKKQDQERYREMNPNSASQNSDGNNSDPSASSDTNPFMRTGNQFSFADLASEIAELTREANRANTTIYTLDPRGLVGAPDLDEKVDMMDYQAHITTSQNSLRVIAEETGGIAGVNRNDLVPLLKRIDAETSDYYMLGYYSSNPDPTQRRRRVEIRVRRPNIELHYRPEYTLKPTKAPPSKDR